MGKQPQLKDERVSVEGSRRSFLTGGDVACAEARPAASWKHRADVAMGRYATGDNAAFGLLYDALQPHLYPFLARHLRDYEAAKDLIQQTFLQLHRTRGMFDPGKSVVPYAFAIARRLCIDLARRGRRDCPLPDDDVWLTAELWTVENDAARSIDTLLALQIIQREARSWLPEQRELFELVHSDGLSYAEVAAILGTTENAIKLRMKRLKATMLAALAHAGAK